MGSASSWQIWLKLSGSDPVIIPDDLSSWSVKDLLQIESHSYATFKLRTSYFNWSLLFMVFYNLIKVKVKVSFNYQLKQDQMSKLDLF